MMKTNRLFAMAMALTIASTAVGSISSFADEIIEPETDVVESEDTFEAVDGRSNEGYTVTDLDVQAEAVIDGSVNVAPYGLGNDAETVEQSVEDISGSKSEPKIYVEVEWESMKFTYDFGKIDKYDWDIKELDYIEHREYKNGKGPAWENDTSRIKFTNYSNREVWTGVSFEKNAETAVYNNVTVGFDRDEVLLPTAVCSGNQLPFEIITMTVEGEPLDCIDKNDPPILGSLKFYISEEARIKKEEKPAETEEAEGNGEHEHHWVYDQFGRLVCTGCNEVQHEFCIDLDEDGLCDECGMERDFCADCHVGGKCICI